MRVGEGREWREGLREERGGGEGGREGREGGMDGGREGEGGREGREGEGGRGGEGPERSRQSDRRHYVTYDVILPLGWAGTIFFSSEWVPYLPEHVCQI